MKKTLVPPIVIAAVAMIVQVAAVAHVQHKPTVW